MFAVQPSAVVVIAGVVLPVDCTKLTPPAPYAAVYFTESAKYASSAVTRFRRSDFIEAMYAFSLVFANFGIAMAARMPIITTTIRRSEEHTSELQSQSNLQCRLLLEKKSPGRYSSKHRASS